MAALSSAVSGLIVNASFNQNAFIVHPFTALSVSHLCQQDNHSFFRSGTASGLPELAEIGGVVKLNCIGSASPRISSFAMRTKVARTMYCDPVSPAALAA